MNSLFSSKNRNRNQAARVFSGPKRQSKDLQSLAENTGKKKVLPKQSGGFINDKLIPRFTCEKTRFSTFRGTGYETVIPSAYLPLSLKGGSDDH